MSATSSASPAVIERPSKATGTTGSRLRTSPHHEAAADRAVGERSARFDASVEEIGARLGSNVFLGAGLEHAALRRLGVHPSSARAFGLAALAGIGFRILAPVTLTAVAGQWAGAPWLPWALVAVLLGSSDAFGVRRHKPSDAPIGSLEPGPRRLLADFSALVGTIEREEDVRQLAGFVRRWYRLPVSALVSAGVALTILVTCLVAAPGAVRALHVGSLAVLVLLLYDFGELAFQNLFAVPFMARMADFDHRLFWPSPMDSVEVRRALRAWAAMQFMVGIAVTLTLVLAIVLVGLDSVLIVPLAASIVVWGYVTTLASMVGVRSSVGAIAGRVRDRSLAELQRRIDAYGPRFAELPRGEAEEVARLIALHATVRDAPTAPATSRTLVHAAVALVIPTIMFIVTVFGEVLAERVLEGVLP